MLKERQHKNKITILLFAIYAAVLTLRYYEGLVNCLNTTAFAFSYGYGFKSRAVMGSILRVLNIILPVNMMSYKGVLSVSILMQLIFVVALLMFYTMVLKNVDHKYRSIVIALMFIFSTFAFPHFVTEENLGRTDCCLAIITLIGVMLLFYEKLEWLIIFLAAVCVCIHQGYVLMFFNVFLVILFVKVVEKNKAKKNFSILAISFVVASVLFIYLNFFSHSNGAEIYDEIYQIASSLAYDGQVHRELMMHEVLGESPFADEWKYHVINIKESLVLLILFMPYIVIAIRFFKSIVKEASKQEKLKYLAIVAGSATILPDIIVKIDFGRWLFCLLFYYFVVILYYCAKGDHIITSQLIKVKERLSQNKVFAYGLLLYPILFVPLGDWKMTQLSINILKLLGQGGNVL